MGRVTPSTSTSTAQSLPSHSLQSLSTHTYTLYLYTIIRKAYSLWGRVKKENQTIKITKDITIKLYNSHYWKEH